MKAAIREMYGSPDVVELRDVERPTPADDQVLVLVRAASVNRADLDGLKPRPGFVRLFMGLRAPRNHSVGLDVAGVVELGPLISRVGNRWMGLLLWWKPFNADDVTTLKELLATGKVAPVIDRRFPLNEVVDALRHFDEGRARGKVVITI